MYWECRAGSKHWLVSFVRVGRAKKIEQCDRYNLSFTKKIFEENMNHKQTMVFTDNKVVHINKITFLEFCKGLQKLPELIVDLNHDVKTHDLYRPQIYGIYPGCCLHFVVYRLQSVLSVLMIPKHFKHSMKRDDDVTRNNLIGQFTKSWALIG